DFRLSRHLDLRADRADLENDVHGGGQVHKEMEIALLILVEAIPFHRQDIGARKKGKKFKLAGGRRGGVALEALCRIEQGYFGTDDDGMRFIENRAMQRGRAHLGRSARKGQKQPDAKREEQTPISKNPHRVPPSSANGSLHRIELTDCEDKEKS